MLFYKISIKKHLESFKYNLNITNDKDHSVSFCSDLAIFYSYIKLLINAIELTAQAKL